MDPGVIGSNQQPPAPGAPAGQPAKPPVPQNTTQNSLLISEIRDGMVIMNDSSFRAVIACKSINFDLMSSREREGVEFSYQNFLNALYFPIQIFIRSQRVDIGPYIERLVTIRRAQDNMLLNVLMDDYINFIDILSQEANIMDKSFFIIVPYYPAGDLNSLKDQSKGFFGKIFAGPQTTATKIDKVTYDKAKDEIKNRVDSVTSGLFQLGVKSVQLNTKELGELYYNMYNPDTAVREPLGDFENVTSTYVKKGEGEAPRPHLQEGEM
jgi:type IV secretory pathway VirB4 component